MKREQWVISSSLGHNLLVTTTWNTTLKMVENEVRRRAVKENETYRLTAKESTRDASGHYYAEGFREWTDGKGQTLRFTIKRFGV